MFKKIRAWVSSKTALPYDGPVSKRCEMVLEGTPACCSRLYVGAGDKYWNSGPGNKVNIAIVSIVAVHARFLILHA